MSFLMADESFIVVLQHEVNKITQVSELNIDLLNKQWVPCTTNQSISNNSTKSPGKTAFCHTLELLIVLKKINVKKYNSHFHSNNGKLLFICVFYIKNIHYKLL